MPPKSKLEMFIENTILDVNEMEERIQQIWHFIIAVVVLTSIGVISVLTFVTQ